MRVRKREGEQQEIVIPFDTYCFGNEKGEGKNEAEETAIPFDMYRFGEEDEFSVYAQSD